MGCILCKLVRVVKGEFGLCVCTHCGRFIVFSKVHKTWPSKDIIFKMTTMAREKLGSALRFNWSTAEYPGHYHFHVEVLTSG